MQKSARWKSTSRKPLADITNGGKPSEACKKKPPPPVDEGDDDDGALDRLLLARSDLASLVNQIDEVVAQALQLKMMSKTGSQEIDSFMHVLSDMHSTLKPWASRLQQALASTSVPSQKQSAPSIHPDEEGNAVHSSSDVSASDLIVSPSPLVSWRAGACTVKSGRQLFLLTPLPKSRPLSSRPRGPPIPMAGRIEVDLTPCLKICGSSQNNDPRIPKPAQPSDEADVEEVSEGWTLRHPETSRTEFDGTLDWFLSPPKTCVLMEPSDAGDVVATPVAVGFESTARRGKRGESTLKRELWVKFDAVSTTGLSFDASVFQKTARKGFLDRLEEEASETNESEPRIS